MSSPTTLNGTLEKRGATWPHTWKRRYFSYDQATGTIQYWANAEKRQLKEDLALRSMPGVLMFSLRSSSVNMRRHVPLGRLQRSSCRTRPRSSVPSN